MFELLSIEHCDHAGMPFRYIVVDLSLEFSSQKTIHPPRLGKIRNHPPPHPQGLESNPAIFTGYRLCRRPLHDSMLRCDDALSGRLAGWLAAWLAGWLGGCLKRKGCTLGPYIAM